MDFCVSDSIIKRFLPGDDIILESVEEYISFLNSQMKFEEVSEIILKKFGKIKRQNVLKYNINNIMYRIKPDNTRTIYSGIMYVCILGSIPVRNYLNLDIDFKEFKNVVDSVLRMSIDETLPFNIRLRDCYGKITWNK